MDFDSFIDQAWDEHAAEPAAVAQRLQAHGRAAVASPAQLARLAQLAHHVLGEHLARWDEGLRFMTQLAALPAEVTQGEAAAAIARCNASLRLCAGEATALQGLAASERVRALALAAANLACHDSGRATLLFNQALAERDTGGLPDTDPCVRALAVTGNNLAVTLEEKAGRSGAETQLMILAATTARRCWALAGGWLATERAEYRLAMSWLQAGDADAARRHALACLDMVGAHQGAALEVFFGHEALARAEAAAGHTQACADAVAAARQAFAALDEADRSWCQPTLQTLEALGSPAGQTAPALS